MGNSALGFGAALDEWGKETEKRMEAIFRKSVEKLADAITEPGPSVASTTTAIKKGLGAKGRGKNRAEIQGPVHMTATGNLPVDTGYLWHSWRMSTEAMPSIDPKSAPPKDAANGSYSLDKATVFEGTLLNATIGTTIYGGFTAAYALRIEHGFTGKDALGREFNQAGRHMVGLAVQRWDDFVREATAEAKASVASRLAVRTSRRPQP